MNKSPCPLKNQVITRMPYCSDSVHHYIKKITQEQSKRDGRENKWGYNCNYKTLRNTTFFKAFVYF